MPSEQIGVITPYRAQVFHVQQLLAKKSTPEIRLRDIEVNTVDQYQGREMDVIICTLVRSKPFVVGQPQQMPSESGTRSEDERNLNGV